MFQGHIICLGETDSMFSAQGPVEGDGEMKDLLFSLLHPLRLVRIIFIIKELGMKISIAGVTEGGNDDIIFFRNLLNSC